MTDMQTGIVMFGVVSIAGLVLSPVVSWWMTWCGCRRRVHQILADAYVHGWFDKGYLFYDLRPNELAHALKQNFGLERWDVKEIEPWVHEWMLRTDLRLS